MNKVRMAALEKVFGAEIENRLPFHSKAKIFATLCGEGLLQPMTRTFGTDRFAVKVEGYQLTHAGRFLFCMECADGEPLEK